MSAWPDRQVRAPSRSARRACPGSRAVRNSGSHRGKSACAPSLALSRRIRRSERHHTPPLGLSIWKIDRARLCQMLRTRIRRSGPSYVTTPTALTLPASREEGPNGPEKAGTPSRRSRDPGQVSAKVEILGTRNTTQIVNVYTLEIKILVELKNLCWYLYGGNSRNHTVLKSDTTNGGHPEQSM